jgi:CRP-like cAMP-binding protein
MIDAAGTDVPAQTDARSKDSLTGDNAESLSPSPIAASPFAECPSDPAAPPATRNQLLARLTADALERLSHSCENVRLNSMETLCTAGQPIEHVYFPTTVIIGLTSPSANHSSVQVAVVGTEGIFASPLLAGAPLSPLGAMALTKGWAMRMNYRSFRSELRQNKPLQLLLNRYLHVLFSQIAELAGCTRHHPVEARLARWLLMIHDRSDGDALLLKHETLAQMLGVQRTGVTLAALKLKRKRLIRYSRGRIVILDRPGLEHVSCECYDWAKNLYSTVLNDAIPEFGVRAS